MSLALRNRDRALAERDQRAGELAALGMPEFPASPLARLADALHELGRLPELHWKVDLILTKLDDLQAAEGRAEGLLGTLVGIATTQATEIKTLSQELAEANAAGDSAAIDGVIQRLNTASDNATTALAAAGVTSATSDAPTGDAPTGDAPVADPAPASADAPAGGDPSAAT